MPAPEDEIIRQVAVDSAERGLLLLRVRDEVRMSTAAYTTLYETSVGMPNHLHLVSGAGLEYGRYHVNGYAPLLP